MLERLIPYGFFGALRLFRDLVLTKLFFRGARLVRYPFYVRGQRRMAIAKGFTTGVGMRMDVLGPGSGICLRIGENVQINDYVHIAAIASVEIGNNVLIASRVFISDHNHGQYQDSDPGCRPEIPPAQRPLLAKPVAIGSNVWIGEQVCILSGVRIGDGAIIGAGSVVTRDIPSNSIAVGAPAMVVREFDQEAGLWTRPKKRD